MSGQRKANKKQTYGICSVDVKPQFKLSGVNLALIYKPVYVKWQLLSPGQHIKVCYCKLEPYFLLTVHCSLTIERILSCPDGGLFHLEEIVTSQLRIPLPIVWSSPLSQKAPASTPGGQVTQTSQRVKPSTDQGCQRLDVALFPKYCPRSELIFVATVVEIRRRNVFRKEFKILFTS